MTVQEYLRQNEKCLICRLGETQWNPTFSLGFVALHPTYKKMAKVLFEKPGWQKTGFLGYHN